MKKIIILIVALFAISTASNGQGNCFPSNCNPPLYQQVFRYPPNSFDLGNGCIIEPFAITVTQCPDGRCSITFIPPTIPANCPWYFNNPKQFLEDIMSTILKTADYPCKPINVGDCTEMIDFYLSSCWSWSGPIDPNNPPTLIPCTDGGCCKVTWRVCKIATEPYFVTQKLFEQTITKCIIRPQYPGCGILICNEY